MPKAREVNWERIGFGRWLDRAHAAAYINTCQQELIEKLDEELDPFTVKKGGKKLTYDKVKLDEYMERRSQTYRVTKL